MSYFLQWYFFSNCFHSFLHTNYRQVIKASILMKLESEVSANLGNLIAC